MKNQDFTTSFTVDHSPEEAFEAINNVRGWWSGEVAGETSKRSMTAMALPLHSARNRAYLNGCIHRVTVSSWETS